MFLQVHPRCFRAQTGTGLLCTALRCLGPACSPRGRAWCSAFSKRSPMSSPLMTKWDLSPRRKMKADGAWRWDSSGAGCQTRLTTQTRSTTLSGLTPSTFLLPRHPPASTPIQRLSTQTLRPRLCCLHVLVNHITTCWGRKGRRIHICTLISSLCTTNTSNRTSLHTQLNLKHWTWTLTPRWYVFRI